MAVCECSYEDHFPEGRATGATPDDHGYRAGSTVAVATATLETDHVFNGSWIRHVNTNSINICQACLDVSGGLHGLQHTTWTIVAI